jgi:ribosomal protein S18 acetylase RimI-like enzyme
MPVSIRLLLNSDIESVEKILSSSFQRSYGWRTDLLLYHKLQPGGYILAELDGTPVGMVGSTIYSTFAYVGLMAVHPDSQRKSIGFALMQYLLDWLDQQQVPLVLLDASPAGQPLYERLGFVTYEKVEIFQRPGGGMACPCPPRAKPISAHDLDLITVPDIKAFGADRSRVLRLLLETYPGRAFQLLEGSGQISGYLFAQENRIGPWVMPDKAGAEELLQAALSLQFPGPISVAVPGENAGASALLQRYGFESVRVNRHMGRGPGAPTGQREKVFGQTSLTLG